jgi:hypothetical protein
VKKITFFLIIILVLIFSGSSGYAGSIILPLWVDDSIFQTMFVIMNTDWCTSNQIRVMFYGKTGNPQAGTHIEKTIPAREMEIFGSGSYPDVPKMNTSDSYGYAIALETNGKLLAVGVVYNTYHGGFSIQCYPGDDEGRPIKGW